MYGKSTKLSILKIEAFSSSFYRYLIIERQALKIMSSLQKLMDVETISLFIVVLFLFEEIIIDVRTEIAF